MINASAAIDQASTGQPKGKPTVRRNAHLFAWFSLLLGAAAGTWLQFQSTQSIRFLTPFTPIAFGAIISLLVIIAGVKNGQRERSLLFQAKEAESQRTVASLQIQLADSRNVAESMREGRGEASEHLSRLEEANGKLRAELDQMKQAEKNLWQRRQELESSKTVLELHVQERTGELQKLQRRYELILNSAGEGICGLDLEGKASFVNPAVARITGWTIEELVGKTEEEIFGKNGKQENGSDNHSSGERTFCRKDGTCLPVEYEKTPIHENGRQLGTVLVFKDISERKRVEEAISQKAAELSRSNAELEQFAFVASHDLQEPLRKIQAFGDRLKNKIKGEMAPEALDYLERMQSASARMRTLTNDLLTFSRVIRRSEPFVRVDTGAVIKGVLTDLEMRIEKSGAKVEVCDLPVVEADPMQMHQLLLNLLTNALKFQPAGGIPVVKISSRLFSSASGEQFCELNVQDNGIGFEEKYLEKMFAVFQRLHGRNEYEGTGVGLAVCRRITDRHHGTITGKSQLGQGAAFLAVLLLRQAKEKNSVCAIFRNPA